jgi:serine/threonine-protein kinase
VPEQLVRIEALLVHYLGPIAPVLVKRAAKQATTRDALIAALAAELDDEKERAAFLTSCRQIR